MKRILLLGLLALKLAATSGPLGFEQLLKAYPEHSRDYPWQTFQRGHYLIIGADNAVSSPYLDLFRQFKERQGFRVTITPLSVTGSSASEIQAYIAQFAADHNLEYVLLIGDVTGAFALPSFSIGAANDVSDLPYVMFRGNDYLPDAFIGRWPVDTQYELAVVINKTIQYCENPYSGSDWLEHALLVAGNYADAGVILTPVWTSRWLQQRLEAFGYTQVDTIFFPPVTAPDPIRDAINAGVGIVNYRGWGDSHGWHYPRFHVSDFDVAGQGSLNNGYQLPVFFSFVCGSGRFDSPVDPCFAEALLARGTVSNPSGAVAVIAPSDLHTRTKYNNAMNSGIWDALLEGRVVELGPALLAAKFELQREFPDEAEPGGMVDFYFHTYNIIGDPSLPVWLGTPGELAVTEADLPAFDGADGYFSFSLPQAPRGVFALRAGDRLIGAGRWDHGLVQVYPFQGGSFQYAAGEGINELELTLTAPGYKPKTLTIPLTAGTDLQPGPWQVELFPGLPEWQPVIWNTGPSASNVQVELAVPDADYSVTFSLSSLPAGALTLGPNLAAPVLPFGPRVLGGQLVINGSAHALSIPLAARRVFLELIPQDSVLLPGSAFTLKLRGQLELPATNPLPLEFTLCTPVDYVQLTDSLGAAVLQNGQLVFSDSLVGGMLSEVAPGSGVPFDILVRTQGQTAPFLQRRLILRAGSGNADEPTPPCRFGYWAYDNTDVGYPEAPQYQWVELVDSPTAQHLVLGDDDLVRIALPFSFPFFGTDYDSLTICSNGWLSFVPTNIAYFRNWAIPGPLGPDAMVAPFWDDLDFPEGGQINIYTEYRPDIGAFVVEWYQAYNRYDNHADQETFEVLLYDPAQLSGSDGSGVIEFQYYEVNDVDQNNNHSTVGIEGPWQNDGVQYVYDQRYAPGAAPLTAGRAIRFTTTPPAGYYSTTRPHPPQVVRSFRLGQPYPNPFNGQLTIPLEIPAGMSYRLFLYDLLGRGLSLQGYQTEARGEKIYLRWNSGELPSGLYFLVLQTPYGKQLKKITLLK